MNVNILTIAGYFLIIALVGWAGIRKAKTKDDYLVAGRNLGSSLYLGTLSAVVLGGASTIGTVKLGYSYGISGVWLCTTIGMGIIILSTVFAGPLLKMRLYTVSQVFARRCHVSVRVTSATIMLAYDLMVAVTSVIAIGSVLQVMFGLSFSVSVLLGGGMVVLYSTLGGMWSLTLTDIIQFIIMTVGMMFILMPASIIKSGGWQQFIQKLPGSYFQLSSIGIDKIILFFVIYLFGILIGQDIWQRVFTARTPGVARIAGFGAGVYCVLYGVCGSLIGMAGKILLPNLSNADDAFAAITREVLPIGLSGVVAAAALAALMSTASACLLASSTIIIEDISPVMRPGKPVGLKVGRILTFAMGLVMLGLALMVKDVLSALTLAYNLLVGGMLIPLIGVIFWARTTSLGAMLSMLFGIAFVIFFMFFHGIQANSPIYAGLIASSLSLLIGSLISPSQIEKPTYE
jgi:solute:Na+ symporter, SSS family